MTASRIALWWVDRYTAGVPETLRAERRAEIVSDLWEQRAASPGGLGTELSVLSRSVRGIPADLVWSRSGRGGRLLPTLGATLRFTAWSLALLAYAFLVGMHGYSSTALLGLELYGGDWEPGDVALYARVSAGLLVLLLAGAALLRRVPRLAVALLAAGTIGTCVAFWWAVPVYGPVGLAVVVAAVVVARRLRGTSLRVS